MGVKVPNAVYSHGKVILGFSLFGRNILIREAGRLNGKRWYCIRVINGYTISERCGDFWYAIKVLF